MKTLLLFIFTLTLNLAFGEDNFFIVTSNKSHRIDSVDNSRLEVFLSYSGRAFNQCGITISTESNDLEISKRIHDELVIDSQGRFDISFFDIENRTSATTENIEVTNYGEFFEVKTKTGESFKDLVVRIESETSSTISLELLNLDCSIF